jgi:hypothetical protein
MLCETVSVSEAYEGALGIDCHLLPRWKTWLQACYSFCVAQERRVWRSVNININVKSWWGMCRLASGGADAWTGGLSSVHDPGVSCTKLSTNHAHFYRLVSLARVGDLTRQADLDSLVLCRKRLAIPRQTWLQRSTADQPSRSPLAKLHTGSTPE